MVSRTRPRISIERTRMCSENRPHSPHPPHTRAGLSRPDLPDLAVHTTPPDRSATPARSVPSTPDRVTSPGLLHLGMLLLSARWRVRMSVWASIGSSAGERSRKPARRTEHPWSLALPSPRPTDHVGVRPLEPPAPREHTPSWAGVPSRLSVLCSHVAGLALPGCDPFSNKIGRVFDELLQTCLVEILLVQQSV